MTPTFVRIFNLYLTIENADYEARPFPVPIYDPSANCTTWENISVRKNELILHILKNREQIETAGRLESKKILASKEACVKSKLSYHIVKFEQSIKVSFPLKTQNSFL